MREKKTYFVLLIQITKDSVAPKFLMKVKECDHYIFQERNLRVKLYLINQ